MSINVGLIGYGFSGAVFQAPIMDRVDGLRLVKVSSSRASDVRRELPDVEVTATAEELIHDPGIDLVIISSPNATHYPLASLALQAGKHVVVEKPFVNDVQEGENLLRLAKEKNCLLSVYHNRRWDGDFLTVRQLIGSGVLGEIHSFESHFDRFVPQVPAGWREREQPGSGTLFDLGAHLIDQALVLFGMPQSIFADLGKQRDSAETVDYFHLLLNYETTKVILHSSMLMHAQAPRFQIHGSKGSYVKHGYDPQEDMLLAGMKPGDPGWGKEKPEDFGMLSQEIGGLAVRGRLESLPGGYERYYQGIADSIRHGHPLPVSGEEALNNIRLIEAAMLSAQEGRAVNVSGYDLAVEGGYKN